jgi:CelD/BcsL family acetyltransferase involved in cellulose biosynthesis
MTIRVPADPSPLFGLDGAAAAIGRARRAVLAERYAASSFTVEWRKLAALAPIVGEWGALAARALEPNVFYEPAFVLAAAPVFGRDAGAVLVWSGGHPRRLLGFFPMRVQRRRYGLPLPILSGFAHPYGPLALPLIEREAAEPVIAACLAHLAADANLPGLLLLPFLPEEGPFATALEVILRRGRIAAADFNRCRRATLVAGHGGADYVARALPRRKRKDLQRLYRRLGEAGAVAPTLATAPGAVAVALEDFFALEARGWKGRAGTAAAADDDLQRFVQTAVVRLAGEGKAAIHRLLLDNRAIAAAIVLRSGAGAWFWKIAYDEGFARFSPGVLLTVTLTEELAGDPAIAFADSCATANHSMIDHIWRQRLALCDRLIALRPGAPFAVARRLEGLRTAVIAAAKRVRDVLY